MQNIHFLSFIVLLLGSLRSFSQEEVFEIYPGNIPELKESKVEENREIHNGELVRVSKVTIPTISVYHPDPAHPNSPRAAVLICPGGGYSYLSFTHEGVRVAKWLNTLGMTGIVLKSRLPEEELMTHKEDVPLGDAQKAMEMIRQNADKWNIDPNKIGVMGFSAGGHLAASLSTHFDPQQKPDFSVLIYPVITMNEKFTHMGSREALLGIEASPEHILKYSTEKQVAEDTPPAFIVHSADDHVVPVTNSIAYYEALMRNNVGSSEMYIFQNGGHGYGMAEGKNGNVAGWPALLKTWLVSNRWIESNQMKE